MEPRPRGQKATRGRNLLQTSRAGGRPNESKDEDDDDVGGRARVARRGRVSRARVQADARSRAQNDRRGRRVDAIAVAVSTSVIQRVAAEIPEPRTGYLRWAASPSRPRPISRAVPGSGTTLTTSDASVKAREEPPLPVTDSVRKSPNRRVNCLAAS